MTASTGSHFEMRDRAHRRPVGTMVPHVATNHLQERVTSGPVAKRTAHPGEGVVTFVGKLTVTPSCILERQAP